MAKQLKTKWHAVHVYRFLTNQDAVALINAVPKLSSEGINVLIVEVDYNYNFHSHPELIRDENPVTFRTVSNLVLACRKWGVRLIPQFQCVGHQSWGEKNLPLLIKYPEFDTTPGAYKKNKDIYCREWDPTNKDIYPIIFNLFDVIIKVFEADAFHVGMDEIFLIGDEKSPNTRRKKPAKVFAWVINKLYHHLVKKHKLEMLMWGDRLIDGKKYNYNKWESSHNDMAGALDLIPKDIIICDWHYEVMDKGYPSVGMFIRKGFRVLPCSWKNVDAAQALIKETYQQKSLKMLGHCFTTWGAIQNKKLVQFPALVKGMELIKKINK